MCKSRCACLTYNCRLPSSGLFYESSKDWELPRFSRHSIGIELLPNCLQMWAVILMKDIVFMIRCMSLYLELPTCQLYPSVVRVSKSIVLQYCPVGRVLLNCPIFSFALSNSRSNQLSGLCVCLFLTLSNQLPYIILAAQHFSAVHS